MPHAQPGTLGIPFQQRRGTAANILDPGGEGLPCSVQKPLNTGWPFWGQPSRERRQSLDSGCRRRWALPP